MDIYYLITRFVQRQSGDRNFLVAEVVSKKTNAVQSIFINHLELAEKAKELIPGQYFLMTELSANKDTNNMRTSAKSKVSSFAISIILPISIKELNLKLPL